ncbi:uncharacterized protein LOC132303340 [Cornus florida]|uniref:uncharacterized protein LOC132303340 n=1 Tax=Cornus florida TaxID=4283 RepID=UPI00289B6791|nr:uncharacterized protein LOC132303340 [Cornus florida]
MVVQGAECKNSNRIKMLQMDLPDICFDENMDLELEIEIREVVNVDDRPGFVTLMKSLYGEQLARKSRLLKDSPETIFATYCPPDIFDWVCIYGAVDCTKALLEGDPFIVDPNVPFKVGLYPLHIAAEDFSYDMIDLLLRHGAWTDVSTIEGEYKGDLLPLDIALQMLSYHQYLSDWTPKQSIFKLIVILSLPQMKVPLETNRLLAWNTKDVSNIFYDYAMEGELIPMAALLMVAREKIMAPSTLQSKDSTGVEGGMMIRQCILKEIALLTDEEVELMCNVKNSTHSLENKKEVMQKSLPLPTHSLKDKKEVMKMALLLLEVFDRAGDAIETYRQSVRYHMSKEKVVKDIKALLQESGIVVKDKDIDLSDIDCESEEIMLATEVLEKRTSFRSQFQDLGMPLPSSSCSWCPTKNRVTNKINEKRWAMYKFLPLASPVLTLARPDYTFELTDKFTSVIPFYRFPLTKKMGPAANRAMKIPPSFFLTLKDFAAFGLAIKRGLTRI